MKTILAVLILMMTSGEFVFAESRTWTNKSGKTLEGEIVAKKGDSISIKTPQGKTLNIKTAMLSEEDNSYIAEWQPSEQDAAAPSPEKKAASNIKFKWNKSDTAAFKQAKETKLPVVILFTGTSWCGYCIKLEKEILSKKEFKDGMDGVGIGLICVSPSPGQWKGFGKDLAQKYGVTGVPKIVVVDADGKVLKTGGYFPGQAPAYYVDFIKTAK